MKKLNQAFSLVALSLLLVGCNENKTNSTSSNSAKETPLSTKVTTKDDKDSPKKSETTSDKKTNSNTTTDDQTVYYTITFDLDGGTIVDETEVKTQKVKEGRWAKKPSINPTKDHCEFLGWYDGNFEYNFNQAVYGNLNLKAKWKVNEDQKVTLTIDPNNGEATYTVDTFLGDRINLKTPSKSGMVFSGWYINDDDDKKFTGLVTEEAKNSSRIVAHYEKQSFNYKYSINDDGTVSIDGILKIDTVTVVIPSTINGRRVTKIGKNAFSSRISITDITISEYITEIERNAFTGCRGLANIYVDSNNTAFEAVGGVLYNKGKTELVLCPPKNTSSAFTVPSSVIKIGDYAFYGHMDAGITSINFNEGLEEIGERAFYNNEKLTSLDFPSTLKKIGAYAFYTPTALSTQMTVRWNDGLEEIGNNAFVGVYLKDTLTLPDSVKIIGDYAFCTPVDTSCAITKVNLPKSLEYFGDAAFFYGMGIKTITLDASNPNFKVVDDILYSKDGKKLVWAPHDALAANNITDDILVIPEGVEELCKHSLSDIDCKTITFPSTLKKIDDDAFHYNYFISSLVIPDTVTEIGEEAFMMMGNLTSFTFGNGITKIPLAAFYECPKLSTIDIPAFITEVGDEAFYCCPLSSITFHEGLEKIGGTAFAVYETGTAKLTSLSFPDSLKSIGSMAFAGQSNLKSITFGKNIDELGNNVFGSNGGCMAPTPTELKATPAAIAAGLKVDNGILISADGKKAMYCISSFAGELNLQEGIEEILPYTFSKVKATKLTLPSTLKTIGECAFSSSFDSSSKVAVNIPSSVETIKEGAFYLSNIGSLTLNDGLVTIEDEAFDNCGISGTLTIPGSVKNIGKKSFGNNYQLKTLVLNEGVETIATEAFQGCSGLEGELAIPSTVKSIGEGAFVGRYNELSTMLTNFTLPNGSNYFTVENTGLYNKDKTELLFVPARTTLTSFALASTCKVVDSYAFGGNQMITTVTLNSVLESINEEAFSYSPVIAKGDTLEIPNTVTYIGRRAFNNWKDSQKISMPWSEDDTLMMFGEEWKNSTKATITYKNS